MSTELVSQSCIRLIAEPIQNGAKSFAGEDDAEPDTDPPRGGLVEEVRTFLKSVSSADCRVRAQEVMEVERCMLIRGISCGCILIERKACIVRPRLV